MIIIETSYRKMRQMGIPKIIEIRQQLCTRQSNNNDYLLFKIPVIHTSIEKTLAIKEVR